MQISLEKYNQSINQSECLLARNNLHNSFRHYRDILLMSDNYSADLKDLYFLASPLQLGS